MNDHGDRTWSVIDYVREEVTRQGHDISQLDGMERVTSHCSIRYFHLRTCSESRSGTRNK
jgi:hypothetical protein